MPLTTPRCFIRLVNLADPFTAIRLAAVNPVLDRHPELFIFGPIQLHQIGSRVLGNRPVGDHIQTALGRPLSLSLERGGDELLEAIFAIEMTWRLD